MEAFPDGLKEWYITAQLGPRASFMAKKGYVPVAAEYVVINENKALMTFNLEDVLNISRPEEQEMPAPITVQSGVGKYDVIKFEPYSEPEIVEELKAEGLDKKVGGLFKTYLNMPQTLDADPEDFLQSVGCLHKIKTEIAPEIYAEAYDYLMQKFIQSKMPKFEQLKKKYNLNSDFALEAKFEKKDIFGTQVYHLHDFVLYIIEPDGNSKKYEIKEFDDAAYALALNKFDNFLLNDIEARKQIQKDQEALIDKFVKKVMG